MQIKKADIKNLGKEHPQLKEPPYSGRMKYIKLPTLVKVFQTFEIIMGLKGIPGFALL